MLEVYMDEVYDLLEPRKKERQKLNVFNNKGEAGHGVCYPLPSSWSWIILRWQVFIYDPKDRKNMDKIWRACGNHEKASTSPIVLPARWDDVDVGFSQFETSLMLAGGIISKDGRCEPFYSSLGCPNQAAMLKPVHAVLKLRCHWDESRVISRAHPLHRPL